MRKLIRHLNYSNINMEEETTTSFKNLESTNNNDNYTGSRLQNPLVEKAMKILHGEESERNVVLYCEDDEMIRPLMEKTFQAILPNSYKVLSFDSADIVIRILKNNLELRKRIAFIVSDFNMPGDNTGGDLAIYLREGMKNNQIPFMLNSGNLNIDQEKFNGAIDEFMPKPTRPSQVSNYLLKMFNKRLLAIIN